MKKLTLILASAGALVLAACSKTADNPIEEPEAKQAGEVVSFGAYLNRNVTKGGMVGELTTSTGTANLQTEGFGVFGYYTDGELYSDSAKPNFMYNQQVTNTSGSAWTYSPAKYWPNEFGVDAVSDDVDRLSFFAYAPWVDVDAATGNLKAVYDDSDPALASATGIIGLSRATAAGDPLVKYVASMNPAYGVDLCWGVAREAFTEAVTTNVSNAVSIGSPFIDVAKPKTAAQVKYDFKHALSQLNVQIDTDVDVVSHNAGELDGFTRIYVRSITFEGFSLKGALNLNANSTDGPAWMDITGSDRLSAAPVTIFDGRRDGKEGVSSAVDANEKPLGLNPKLIQSVPYSESYTPGVQHTAVNLFASDEATAPVYVIPNGEVIKLTIVYDVETRDSKLYTLLSDGATPGSTVENTITKTIPGFRMEAGNRYNIALHVGMTSVKFSASVAPWSDGATENVNVPVNVE
ncbi:MAG: fimbrillin family protein [Bacteroidales bacterium]|nr:fimbrillin family protein [Bacteroidales bacterium]